MLRGALDANMISVMVIYLVSSFLNAAYFFPILIKAFFYQGDDKEKGVKEAPLFCFLPPLVTASITIYIFFFPRPFLDLSILSARYFIGG